MKHSDGGKGDSPRKQQDQKAYEDGWNRIFGQNKLKVNDETGSRPRNDNGSQDDPRSSN